MPPRHLRSKDALLFQTLTIGFTVQQNGDINDAPRKFVAGPDEIVTWLIGNAGGQSIRVTLKQFLRKKKHTDSTGDPADRVEPFIWYGSPSVTVSANQAGIIAGRRDPAYHRRDLVDVLSYTIQVDGPFGTIEYDPDGDIKP